MPTCTETIELLKEKLEEQDQLLKEITAAPKTCGVILGVSGDRVRVAVHGSINEYHLPKEYKSKAKVGASALIGQDAGIVDIQPIMAQPGSTAVVKSVLSKDRLEVLINGDTVVVMNAGVSLEAGDRVQLDMSRSVAMQKLAAPPAPTVTASVETVKWDDIGGLQEAKAAIEEAVLWPLKHAKLLGAYAQRPAKGLLFYGPPGCGKTMLAKATATALAEHGQAGFFPVRGPELVNPYVGETERAIRELFIAAREHQDVHGTRAVVFVDEADSVLSHRGRALHSDISVPAFLVEMDGIDAATAPLVILATNRANDLDQAVIREGRVDRRVLVDRPSEPDVKQLFELYLRSRPLSESLVEMAQQAAKTLFSSNIWDFRSGAQVAALVDRATNLALRRDLDANRTKPTGVMWADLSAAIADAATTHVLQY